MLLGLVAAIVVSAIDYEKLLRSWYFVALLGLIPVFLTFFIGVAPEGTDDKAWLDLGFTTFQPAELLKICFAITFSAHIRRIKANINQLKYLLPLCLHGAFPVMLIHFQGDDGTALVFAVMVIFMMWAGGVSWKYFLVAFSAALAASPFLYFFVMNDDQRSRIASLFDGVMDIQGADYLGVGAIYPTTTKVKTVLTSTQTLSDICKAVPIPVNAIGGLNIQNIDVLKGIAISGVCVVSAIMKADDPAQAAAELKTKIEAELL